MIRTSSEPTGVKSTQEYDHQDVRTRTNTMGEESVKIQYVTNKAIEENTIKLQQMSADIRYVRQYIYFLFGSCCIYFVTKINKCFLEQKRCKLQNF